MEAEGPGPPQATEVSSTGTSSSEKWAKLYLHRGCGFAQSHAMSRHYGSSLTMQAMAAHLFRSRFWVLGFAIATTIIPKCANSQESGRNEASAQSPAPTPAFTDENALSVLDNLQAALQSYNRKKFLAQFNSANMPNFSAFQNEIQALFDRYDSFTVTYHLVESAMQNGKGVALADFGLDATSSENDTLDLRRHTRLRIVVAWTGKEWEIVDLSPTTIFE